MKKYRVIKQTYSGKFIEDLGDMTIEEIEKLAKEYIGDVFVNEEEIQEDMEYIKIHGDELWLCNGRIEIKIEEVK